MMLCVYVIVQVFAQFRKISRRVWSSLGLYLRSSQNTHGDTKQAQIVSRMEQKPAGLPVYHALPPAYRKNCYP